MATAGEMEYLMELADRMKVAQRGQKTALVAEGAKHMNISRVELYRRMKEKGLVATTRKPRSDRGKSAITEEELRLVAGMCRSTTRGNGRQILSIKDAVSLARANGMLQSTLTADSISRLLWQRGMHPEQLATPAPHVTMASRHPNHVWQIDASVCVLYYLRQGGLAVMDESEFYKNKPQNIERIEKQRIIRYAVTDHYTGAFYAEDFLGAESSENITNFFLNAICKREGDPFHGVPLILLMDAGSANTSKLFLNLLKNLDVTGLTHTPKNPRAKGGVEVSHKLIEHRIESRFAFKQYTALEEINKDMDQLRRDYCARAIHTRHGRTRYGFWMTIQPEHLRLAPPLDLCRELVTTVPTEATVGGDMTISYSTKKYGSMAYDVRHVPEAFPTAKITVRVNPYRAPAVDVLSNGQWLVIEPVEKDDAGFPVQAPVFNEDYHGMPDTVVDRHRKIIDLDALGDAKATGSRRVIPYQGRIDPLADVAGVEPPAYLPRRGTELVVDSPEIIRLPARPPVRRVTEEEATPEQLFAKWQALQGEIRNGGEVGEEDRRWVVTYQKSKQFAAMHKSHQVDQEATPEQLYQRWRVLHARIDAEEEVEERERRWVVAYQKSKQFAAMHKKSAVA